VAFIELGGLRQTSAAGPIGSSRRRFLSSTKAMARGFSAIGAVLPFQAASSARMAAAKITDMIENAVTLASHCQFVGPIGGWNGG
jgi:hypothetical protein